MNSIDVLNNNQAYLEDFITRAVYHSNALEGSTLTKNETYALTFDSNHCPISANAKEIHQAINLKRAMMEMLKRVSVTEPLKEEYLVHANDLVNENILYGGSCYRVDPAKVSGSNKLFPDAEEIEDFLQEFIRRFNDKVANGFDMKDVARMHIEFENIRPFTDGNGRTGRILINSMLLGGGQTPLVIPLESRNDYIKLLETNNVTGLAELFEKLQAAETERLEDFCALE